MADITSFPPDYFTARERFRTASAQCNARHQAFAISPVGPQGQELSIDLAWITGQDPSRLLVISSALHGIEGYFGSAVQLECLGTLQRSADPPPVSILLIHAINPYGFAWRRRTNESNVDLNRNFLLPGDSYNGAPKTLRDLNSLINPPSPPPPITIFVIPAVFCIARYGFESLKQALTSGQYEFPEGLFYGGKAPEGSTRLIQTHFHEWISPARKVLHLDFHTGLGRYGTYKLLSVDQPGSERWSWLSKVFGEQSLVTAAGNRNRDDSWRGGMGPWLSHHLANTDVDYTYVLPEFGTYAGLKVFGALRDENRVNNYPRHRRYERLKQRLKDIFIPPDPAWREKTLVQSAGLIDTSIESLKQ